MRDFQTPGRSIVYASNGLCATSHPLAAATAVDVLKGGGNAVDAGVAAAFLLGICEPAMTGAAGDCFAIYAPPQGGLIGMNASGRAPAAADAGALRDKHGAAIDRRSADAVTVPGAVAGLCQLVENHGRRGREAALAPAIRYADEGVPVAPRAAFDWRIAMENLQGSARQHYGKNDGPYAAGDLFRLPGMAEVFRRIAAEGAKGFYEGEVAEDMVAALQAAGGVHTLDDFAGVKADYVDTISTTYKGHELIELPPNGQGPAALLMLDMLAQFDLTDLDPLGVDRAHLEAEAAKLAYDARNRFVSEPASMGDGLERMLDPELAGRLAARIDRGRALSLSETEVIGAAEHKETVYLCVVDGDGGALSLIYSIFDSFGSGLASEKFGLLFHNRGAGFNLHAGHRNEIGPGKRPMHTIIPAMLRMNGSAVMPFGVMGGQYQAAGHARLITNLLDFEMDLQTSIDAPRIFPQDGRLRVEHTLSPVVLEGLSGLGHDLEYVETPIGGAQAIWIDADRGVLMGASDPRKDGCALGY
ncbi:MAG: gamma-glutamyltransferase family protein [Pseudomonadota bacterium]